MYILSIHNRNPNQSQVMENVVMSWTIGLSLGGHSLMARLRRFEPIGV